MFGTKHPEMHALLDQLEAKMRNAQAYGWTVEVVVLPKCVMQWLDAALKVDRRVWDAYGTRQGRSGISCTLLGIKVMWSEGRLPPGQIWLRLQGAKQ